MSEYLWPWEASVMIRYPWLLLITFMILSFPLSIISWRRDKKYRKNRL